MLCSGPWEDCPVVNVDGGGVVDGEAGRWKLEERMGGEKGR